MNRTDRNALVRGLNALAEMLDLVGGIASEQDFDALDRYRHKAEETYDAAYAAYEGLLALARKEGAQWTDPFFSARTCARCGADLEKTGRTMSMFNTEAICPRCKEEERLRPDYAEAVAAERAAIRRGDFNYSGIETDHSR